MRVTTTPLAEVALACGFSDQCHFTRVFSQATGTTPSQWRRLTCVPSSTLNGPTNWAA
jgi:transcriptional regulator GlxA family with amidase domain